MISIETFTRICELALDEDLSSRARALLTTNLNAIRSADEAHAHRVALVAEDVRRGFSGVEDLVRAIRACVARAAEPPIVRRKDKPS